MNNPLVSICIPTYNGEEFIGSAMESALNQTYRPLEVVVSDDASSDDTLVIVNRFIRKTDIKIKVVRHAPSGIGANWNNCVENSEGKYIKFLFQDDLLKPECIEEMMSFVQVDQGIGLVFSKRELLVSGDRNEYEEWISQFNDLQAGWTKITGIQEGKLLLKDPNFLSKPNNKVGEPTAVMLSRAVFEKVGYFNTELRQALDYEFWYRVFKYFKIGYIDKELVIFRLHSKQATVKNSTDTIPDYQVYPRIVYNELFWQLNWKLKKQLFFRYNSFGRFVGKYIQ